MGQEQERCVNVGTVAPVGPCYGDTRGQAATPRHVGDKSCGYQGNGVSNRGASTQSTGRPQTAALIGNKHSRPLKLNVPVLA